MKKAICGIVALCMFIMPLTGCGKTEKTGEEPQKETTGIGTASSGNYAPFITDFFLSVYEQALEKQENPEGEKEPEAEEAEEEAEKMLGVKLEDVKVSDTLKEQIKENPVISSPEKNKQALGGSSTQGNSGGASAQQSQPATQKATSAPKPPTTQPATQKPTSAPKPPATQPPTQNAEWWPSRAEIDQIIAECRSYGESIGMIWADYKNKDNASWDSPEEVRWYRRLGKEEFVQTLKEFLEIDYNAGFCYFKLWVEPYENTWKVYIFC